EMVFYLIVTALFVAGVHRRSSTFAVVFGVLAFGLGLVLSAPFLPGPWPAILSAVVFVAGMVCLITGRFRTTAAYLLGLMALTLVSLGSFAPWLGAAIIAVMFTGTALYRWERGTGRLWPVGVVAALVLFSPVWADEANWGWVQPQVWMTTVGLAAA